MPDWLKLLGVWGMYLFRRRMAGVFIDPVMSCNLRCRMCYFSDPVKRKSMSGVIADRDLDYLEKAILPYALKMQIGCGAEPTLYGCLPDLIARGKRSGVPYISLTTNGQLIASGHISLEELLDAGLDEIILSMHGTDREVYEALMPGADFSLLKALINNLSSVKSRFPGFRIRVNFTVNSYNMDCLTGNRFWQLWDDVGCLPDIVQLRPVQKIGDTDWKDFDMDSLLLRYDSTFGNVIARCRKEGIVCMAPTQTALKKVATDQSAVAAIIEDLVYCYVSPDMMYKPDFDKQNDTFYIYNRRMNTGRRMLGTIFNPGKGRKPNKTKKLNYKIR